MEQLAWAYQGQLVEIRDGYGGIHRGVIEGVNQRRGLFLRTSPFRRIFIPFFLITSLFLLTGLF
ncbi:hypothetical protein BKP45_20960 [Anaerobacillus alkalidiazotrophicus]|uniref:Uncharacterized protein n=1 Tax=Anaerobacillus alkalidiazotrophicus TaxID=472963 RepID=A0A1S2LWY3_9BACI|nr:hypothetical protein [Anaerobacillus alkalidiazotrophicus]OIJ16846.1 hypothetical protein BKP45_20960 [Anaerobacillus alkalidiazotrophicus]